MSYFNSKAGKVYYEIEGEGNPLVFIHGRTLDSRMWKPQIEHFSNKYKCIVYDLNGFGKSEIPKDSYNRSETLKELLEHLSIKNATFIALSLGVDVLVDFVLLYPQYVKSMILLSGAVSGWTFSDEFMSDWNQITDTAQSGNLDKAKALWIRCKAFSLLKEKKPKNYQLLEEIISDYTGWDLVKAPKHQRFIENALERIAEIHIPTLIITGEKDYPDFIENGKEMNRRISGSKYDSIKNSGHMVNLEFPEKINELIENFLNN
jgi:pimeloyl-ACP methyl ester carboxylesterase